MMLQGPFVNSRLAIKVAALVRDLAIPSRASTQNACIGTAELSLHAESWLQHNLMAPPKPFRHLHSLLDISQFEARLHLDAAPFSCSQPH